MRLTRAGVALAGLLATTATLYLWRLGDSGWANSYYAAAAQAGARSGSAFFFGAFDPSGSITVDKPSAFLWPMALSVRLFGLSPWSILVPQALAGVAAVGVLYATVRRWYGPAAGLITGAVLAATPVAALMFRFNNPDALLVLLLVLAGYATVRATETAGTGWLVAAGAMVGAGFLTKLGQALLIVPALAAVHLLAAPTGPARRCWQVGAAGVALVASAGWYVAIVELTPPERRPYVGGSPTNSLLELSLGYNGLGRLAGGQPVAAGIGDSGPTRLFDLLGDQIAWLLPAAVILLVAGVAFTWQRPRTDRERAGLLLWGGWLVVTGGVFSLMRGIIHAYYTVALAPAIAALVGIGTVLLWRQRHRRIVTVVLAVAMADTAWWSATLLARHPQWHPWLRYAVLAAGLAVAGSLLVLVRLPVPARRAVAAGGLAVALAGPFGYAVVTAATPHGGADPVAGPAARAGPPPESRPDLVAMLRAGAADHRWAAATVGTRIAADLQLAAGLPVLPIGGFIGLDPTPSLGQFQRYVAERRVRYLVTAPGPANHEITAWVAGSHPSVIVDGLLVYDLQSSSPRR